MINKLIPKIDYCCVANNRVNFYTNCLLIYVTLILLALLPPPPPPFFKKSIMMINNLICKIDYC